MGRQQQQTKGPDLTIYQIIERPILSEKSIRLAEEQNQYTFEVHPAATKEQIRRAVEELFDVRVEAVRVIKIPGKQRRARFTVGRTKAKKKAIVKLHPDDRLSFI